MNDPQLAPCRVHHVLSDYNSAMALYPAAAKAQAGRVMLRLSGDIYGAHMPWAV